MFKRRVVVTGIGIISPLGNSIDSTWNALISGKSGIEFIKNFDTTIYTTRFAGLVKNFNFKHYFSNLDAKRMDMFIQYGVAAAMQAWQDCGLSITSENNKRIGIAIGSSIGGLELIEKNYFSLINFGPRKVNPFFIPYTISNMISGYLSIKYGLHGPAIAINTACSTGLYNIGISAKMIAYNDVDIMIAGGSEKTSTPLGISGFNAAKVLSTRNDNPKIASRPWDKDRDGFVLGDGAGVVILEEYEHAKRRNAKIYAEVVGFGMSSDAYHITSPSKYGEGAIMSMNNALFSAKIRPDEITYINAHATSTIIGDISETRAIKSVFTNNLKKIMISSTKSMTGHLLGAAGAVESIFSILALRDQIIPPTINLDNPDNECDLDYVPKEARQVKGMLYTLCNSFGFGGINGSLIFRNI